MAEIIHQNSHYISENNERIMVSLTPFEEGVLKAEQFMYGMLDGASFIEADVCFAGLSNIIYYCFDILSIFSPFSPATLAVLFVDIETGPTISKLRGTRKIFDIILSDDW